ncbi:hypothetical protein E2562_019773 [Oryza meyeriana var. granulata]|uniref:Uncharacterized protein n=1 Tax=Oryza meyeriana var. granulata TaxID=110450 RepID=A0A6G1DLI1_9ORYZ|nr:hypothetical protein E2562_019773 [Oryza meyeriana var. granulata]
MSASISNVKLMDKHEVSKELQCTADSRLDALPKDHFSPVVNGQEVLDKPCSQLEVVSTSYDGNKAPDSMNGLEIKEKKKKDKKDKKRNRDKKDDPEYLEKKRLKKEKKRMEKEKGKKQKEGEGVSSSEQKNIAIPSDSQGTSSARPPAPIRTSEPQILRMTGVTWDFSQCADVAAVLGQHRRIREQLRRISHWYCKFIVSCLLLVTASQFSTLLAAMRPHV